jgi:hypothetical protein
METNNKTWTFLKKCLTRQFKSVGHKFSLESVKEPNWFLKYSWTSQEREKFHSWFVETIRKDLRLNKKGAEQEWQYYNLMWGWRDEI